MKVKIFNGPDESRLEREINDWLEEQQYAITLDQIHQSESADDSSWSITISIWYFVK